ncbi:MAG TPA: hypothetical protein VKA46_12835 [Gemmataceae bacterium]|nr:hypothetical protein [Gemmataceae bacterium]
MNELWRWVDPRVEKVRLGDLRAYLLARGWKLKSFPQPQVLVFEEPVEGGEEPVVQVLPVSEQARDFRRSVIDAITSLSALEDRHPVAVLEEILRQAPRDRPASPNGPARAGEALEAAGPGPPSPVP